MYIKHIMLCEIGISDGASDKSTFLPMQEV